MSMCKTCDPRGVVVTIVAKNDFCDTCSIGIAGSVIEILLLLLTTIAILL